ncbi:MAG: 4-hydroxy-tetrahydrodipicolinate reductase [Bacteroidetes bacterium]|jgi:4-hydroxy-tetrahydrodipicolinate reductase|nr:4-hydroxy-tetrahydrodipicolinate reductase [Bacteroidota bacterium]MBT6686764.1 4-hydroxy-tetrahydrodipicolinate reductase [Bacteroidota bacterium]MBT7141997.1 4-hydroxy-tetrahydrodipicolinate reductase [Bacteroidota bacterium]MBT7492493.1 4-hydroxy-tetrahydrodipicolinate reductase [Bacteroidota bacterium]
MNIAIIGYGKMGKEIEKLALERNHKIVAKIDFDNLNNLNKDIIKNSDVAIEFTNPKSAFDNYMKCFEANVPVVSGTTGWLSNYDKLKTFCIENEKTFFYASNFSLGVNIFFELNKKLAKIMDGFENYDVSIEETHHTEKLDAPSGTAITLANKIVSEIDRKKSWTSEGTEDNQINIKSFRLENVTGEHTIKYDSHVDSIQLKHEAKNRKGFALGAILAAEFTAGKTGIFGMEDLLKL